MVAARWTGLCHTTGAGQSPSGRPGCHSQLAVKLHMGPHISHAWRLCGRQGLDGACRDRRVRALPCPQVERPLSLQPVCICRSAHANNLMSPIYTRMRGEGCGRQPSQQSQKFRRVGRAAIPPELGLTLLRQSRLCRRACALPRPTPHNHAYNDVSVSMRQAAGGQDGRGVLDGSVSHNWGRPVTAWTAWLSQSAGGPIRLCLCIATGHVGMLAREQHAAWPCGAPCDERVCEPNTPHWSPFG